MDLESVNAVIRSAEETARVNEAKIVQSRTILKRATETLERVRRRYRSAQESGATPEEGWLRG